MKDLGRPKRDVLITGSREISEEGLVAVDEVVRWLWLSDMNIVVGEAGGVDQRVIAFARGLYRAYRDHKDPLEESARDFVEVHGAYSKLRLEGFGTNIAHDCNYFERNLRMIERIKPDGLVVAFWNGKSRGTKHTFENARKAGLEIIIKEFRND